MYICKHATCYNIIILDGQGPSEGSWSAVGSVALRYDKSEPTMVLDLSNMTPQEIDATIIHQFGHALGLGHALIKKDEWDVLEEYVNASEVKKSFNLPVEQDFEMQWTGQGAEAICNYDKKSVMLYK